MDTPQLLTLTEFAEAIKRSDRQIRRYVQLGHLTTVETEDGTRISADQVEAWKQMKRSGQKLGGSGQSLSCPDISGHDRTDASGQPDMSGQTQLDMTGQNQMSALTQALELSSRLLEKLEHAQLSAERERRRADQLAFEIQSYQRVLSEQAESLAEQRAATIQAEAQRLAAEMVTSTIASSQLEHQVELEQLKIDMPTPARGWGSRLKRLLFRKVG